MKVWYWFGKDKEKLMWLKSHFSVKKSFTLGSFDSTVSVWEYSPGEGVLQKCHTRKSLLHLEMCKLPIYAVMKQNVGVPSCSFLVVLWKKLGGDRYAFYCHLNAILKTTLKKTLPALVLWNAMVTSSQRLGKLGNICKNTRITGSEILVAIWLSLGRNHTAKGNVKMTYNKKPVSLSEQKGR